METDQGQDRKLPPTYALMHTIGNPKQGKKKFVFIHDCNPKELDMYVHNL